jgi:hypothetical protein
VVDVCDLATGLVSQVIAPGRAELLPLDVARGRRTRSRTLGQDETRWDRRFRHSLREDPAEKGTRVAGVRSRVPRRKRSELPGPAQRW